MHIIQETHTRRMDAADCFGTSIFLYAGKSGRSSLHQMIQHYVLLVRLDCTGVFVLTAFVFLVIAVDDSIFLGTFEFHAVAEDTVFVAVPVSVIPHFP